MTFERSRIVVAEPISNDALQRLRTAGTVVFLQNRDTAALHDALAECEAIVVRSYVQVDASLFDAAPRLRVIGRAGTGLDNIDLDEARRRGVTVVYTPAAATNAVAEHTVALMLALERRLIDGHRMVHESRFLDARRGFVSRELCGLTLGVIGMGRIGRAVASICRHGLGMTILYNDIVDPGWLPFVATPLDKLKLLECSDVVTLHVPLSDSTRGLIHREAIQRMKPTATLVNTARGPVVDIAALAEALNAEQIAGAALDVHDPEPPGDDYPLLNLPNCVLAPHVASRTESGLARMNDVVDDVIAVLHGDQPAYPA